MKLSNLLVSIRKNQDTEKTASAVPVPVAAPAPTETKLAGALREAVSESTKVASTQTVSPVAEVMKIAAEVADGEKLAALKESALLGAAYADAAIARFAEWQKAAGELPAPLAQPVMGQKVAAVNSGAVQADATFSKYAEENPVLARQAIALGYAPTAGGLEKMAEDSYIQGYNDQVGEIHKVAAEEFLKAAALTSLIIEKSQKTA